MTRRRGDAVTRRGATVGAKHLGDKFSGKRNLTNPNASPFSPDKGTRRHGREYTLGVIPTSEFRLPALQVSRLLFLY